MKKILTCDSLELQKIKDYLKEDGNHEKPLKVLTKEIEMEFGMVITISTVFRILKDMKLKHRRQRGIQSTIQRPPTQYSNKNFLS